MTEQKSWEDATNRIFEERKRLFQRLAEGKDTSTLGRLSRIDPDYPWQEFWNLREILEKGREGLAYMLATRLHDSDAQFNEYTWEYLERVEMEFGAATRGAVLYNLFHRNHDT